MAEFPVSTNRYRFSGKESQTTGELGLLDFGARMYDAEIGRWWNMDPLADKYAGISPYVYCANDPIKFIDPNGKEIADSLFIFGDDPEAAMFELQKTTSLNISRDGKTGKVSASGTAKSSFDKILSGIINHSNVTVNVRATGGILNSKGGLLVTGSFMGTRLSEDKTSVNTFQELNVARMSAMSDFYGSPGGDMMHEIDESFIAGQRSLMKGRNAKPNGSIYQYAHDHAIPQTGNLYEELYDKSGERVYNIRDARLGDWYVKSGNLKLFLLKFEK